MGDHKISALEMACILDGARDSSTYQRQDWCPHKRAKCPFYDTERGIRVIEYDNGLGQDVAVLYHGCEFSTAMVSTYLIYMGQMARKPNGTT